MPDITIAKTHKIITVNGFFAENEAKLLNDI